MENALGYYNTGVVVVNYIKVVGLCPGQSVYICVIYLIWIPYLHNLNLCIHYASDEVANF
jgi:hypothetical protein